jgi:hypothetical protein
MGQTVTFPHQLHMKRKNWRDSEISLPQTDFIGSQSTAAVTGLFIREGKNAYHLDGDRPADRRCPGLDAARSRHGAGPDGIGCT